jgi:hypothetical protein
MSFRLSVKSEPLGFARVSSTPNPKAVCRFDFVSCESQPKNGVIHKTAFSQIYVWNDNPSSVSLGKPLTLDEVFIRAQPKGALQVDIRHCFRGRLLRSAFRCVLLHSRAWRVEVRPPCRQLAPELQKSKQLEFFFKNKVPYLAVTLFQKLTLQTREGNRCWVSEKQSRSTMSMTWPPSRVGKEKGFPIDVTSKGLRFCRDRRLTLDPLH